jgi:hypothetical protein
MLYECFVGSRCFAGFRCARSHRVYIRDVRAVDFILCLNMGTVVTSHCDLFSAQSRSADSVAWGWLYDVVCLKDRICTKHGFLRVE